jgi:hypothetical protein
LAETQVHQVVDVPAPPEPVLQQIMSVSGADKYQPIMHSPQGVQLARKRFPTWAIVLAVLLFPIGLLFLLAKEENNVWIGIEPLPTGTRVTIQGEASRTLMSALQYVLGGNIATPAGLPQNVVPMPGPPPPPPPANL